MRVGAYLADNTVVSNIRVVRVLHRVTKPRYANMYCHLQRLYQNCSVDVKYG